MSNTDDQPSDVRDTSSDVRIRRAPKFPTFLILGGGVGAIVSFILTALFPVDPAVGFGALFGYFALYGVTAGVLVGALIAIVLDRRSLKHVSTVAVTVETTVRAEDPADYADADADGVAGADADADAAGAADADADADADGADATDDSDAAGTSDVANSAGAPVPNAAPAAQTPRGAATSTPNDDAIRDAPAPSDADGSKRDRNTGQTP